MSLQELKKRYEASKAELEALGKEIEALETEIDYSTWWPREGEGYFFIPARGGVVPAPPGCPIVALSHSRYTAGGLFATREHAETWLKIDKRYWELMQGVTLDWKTEKSKVWFYFNHKDDDVLACTETFDQNEGSKHMPPEVADTLFKEFTQAELKLWVLGAARR